MIIFAFISFVVAVLMVTLAIWCLIESFKYNDEYATVAFILIFPTILLLLPTFIPISRDKMTTYREPTSIVKTNNATSVVFIESDGSTHHWSYKEVSYWNAQNIVIEETSGKNFWGKKVQSNFDCVLTNNVILEK